jgi:hypothetical protein
MGLMQRTLAAKSKPTQEIAEAGGEYTIKRLTALKNTEARFKLGQEFEFQRFDDVKVMAVFNLEDGKFVEKQHGGGVHSATAVWTFSPSELTVESEAGGVVATEVYKRL